MSLHGDQPPNSHRRNIKREKKTMRMMIWMRMRMITLRLKVDGPNVETLIKTSIFLIYDV